MPFATASGMDRSERAIAAKRPSANDKMIGEKRFALASVRISDIGKLQFFLFLLQALGFSKGPIYRKDAKDRNIAGTEIGG